METLPRLDSLSQYSHLGVSENRGSPKSSILIGFSIINHPFWDTPIFGNIHLFILFIPFLSKLRVVWFRQALRSGTMPGWSDIKIDGSTSIFLGQ